MSRVAAAVALVLVAGNVSAETLGEAAAKERQRRERQPQKATPAPRVITEEELVANKGRLANEPAPDPAPPAEPVPNAPVVTSAAAVEAERTLQESREARWRLEAQRRREKLAMAERNVQRTQRWADPTYAGADRPSCPITARNEHKKARAALERARQSLDALEDEARRGGALPGWIR